MDNKEVINIKNKQVKPDLFGQLEQLNKKYEQKFLKEIYPLIKKYYDFTGKDFDFRIPDEIIIEWNGVRYWVYEGKLGYFGGGGIWWEKASHDNLGRPFGNERNGNFYLIARLCCKYEKEIKTHIESELIELMK